MKTPPIIRRLLVVLVSGLLVSSFMASSAHAANLDGNCDNNEACIYKNANFSSGGIRDVNQDDDQYSGNIYPDCNVSCNLDNSASSMKNTRSHGMFYFQHSFGGGGKLHVAAESSRANLSLDAFPGGGSWNDRVSSHCWVDTPPFWCNF